VGVKTWVPLQEAGKAMDELDESLGRDASYIPTPSGGIAPERIELFLDLRASLVSICDEYGGVRKAFDSVATLETRDSKDPGEVGVVAYELGGAALSITPFLARFFEQRNEALLAAAMGLQEYTYIYAAAYHDDLLSEQIRNEIFSDGDALSPEASEMLRGCLERQLAAMPLTDIADPRRAAMETELKRMEADPSRLIWQDGLPEVIRASFVPYRERLDRVFCEATAGLEMERSASRAIRVALE